MNRPPHAIDNEGDGWMDAPAARAAAGLALCDGNGIERSHVQKDRLDRQRAAAGGLAVGQG